MYQIDSIQGKVQADFDKAKFKGFLDDVTSLITKKDNHLYSFEEIRRMVRPYNEKYLGLRAVKINDIIGSEGRYNDFNKSFLPKRDNTRDRWESIDTAHYQQRDLPPVLLYKVGYYYFVKDGNHRVSVAREKGQEYIDAEIVEFKVKVDIDKDMDIKDLIIKEGHTYFLEKTRFDELTKEDILITAPLGYDILLDHIEGYKYFYNKKNNCDLSFDQGVLGWYREVYLPIVEIIRKDNILKDFPGREEGDLYLWISNHYYYLKQNLGELVCLEFATKDFTQHHRKRSFIVGWFKKLKQQLFDKKNN